MTVIEAGKLKIHLFVWDYIDSNAYVVEGGTSALIIDPVDTEEFWRFLKEKDFQLIDIALTHEHFDHISGVNKLREQWNCMVYAHRKCSENIGITTRNLSGAANVLRQVSERVQRREDPLDPFICAPADAVFDERYMFCWEGHKVELVHTPGHSAGSTCIVLDERILFSGDTLLATPTITRLPGGNKKIFQESTILWVNEKAEAVKWVLPGHGNIWKRAIW